MTSSVMPSIVMLSVIIILSVVILNAFMLNVVAPNRVQHLPLAYSNICEKGQSTFQVLPSRVGFWPSTDIIQGWELAGTNTLA
jgi:hypothetical protein